MKTEDLKLTDEIFLSKKCAWLYYISNLNQSQIAKKIGLIKMRVHKLITFADKHGFGKTFVEGGFDKTFEYEKLLKEKYQIKICELIPNDKDDSSIEMLGAAVALVSMVPGLLFLFAVQKHIVAGLTFGAVKG